VADLRVGKWNAEEICEVPSVESLEGSVRERNYRYVRLGSLDKQNERDGNTGDGKEHLRLIVRREYSLS
jgi:hypothetical protein